MTWLRNPGADRRVQRTERLLHGALGALIHEKPYGAIAVKEILARAKVGRATFYSHFRGKDELLASGIREMLHSSERRSRAATHRDVLWFSLAVFEHVEQLRGTSSGRMTDEARAVVHGHLRDAVVELFEDELRHCPGSHAAGDRVPPELLARQIAATFIVVLDWWVERGIVSSAVDADGHFRALAQPAVAAWTGQT